MGEKEIFPGEDRKLWGGGERRVVDGEEREETGAIGDQREKWR